MGSLLAFNTFSQNLISKIWPGARDLGRLHKGTDRTGTASFALMAMCSHLLHSRVCLDCCSCLSAVLRPWKSRCNSWMFSWKQVVHPQQI